MVAEFCKNSKAVPSDFLTMKNIVALSSLSSLAVKLICWFKSKFSN